MKSILLSAIAVAVFCTALPLALSAPNPAATPQAVAAVPGTPAPATSAEEGDTPEKIIARFFAYIQRKDVDLAYDQLTKGTKIAERAEDVRTLKAKTKEAISVFGVMLGYDFVGKKSVGDRLFSYTCLSLGKEFPLRWRFYFYRPADQWKLIDLRVDDRLAAMFDEPEEVRPRETKP